MQKLLLALLALTATIPAVRAAGDVPVPATCTPQVNQKLSQLLNSGQQADVYNVMVCGVTTGPSRTQFGGPHGNHEILSLRVALPDGSSKLIEVVTNDSLDGVVSAPASAQVFAYGRAYFSNVHQYAAGIDDVHCATNRSADNGWVVVNGKKYPNHC
jgi:hypothetical protein